MTTLFRARSKDAFLCTVELHIACRCLSINENFNVLCTKLERWVFLVELIFGATGEGKRVTAKLDAILKIVWDSFEEKDQTTVTIELKKVKKHGT